MLAGRSLDQVEPLVEALTPRGATVVAIQEIKHRVFTEIQSEIDKKALILADAGESEPDQADDMMSPGFDLVPEDEQPAWIDDESLTVSLTTVRDSIETDRQSQAAAQRWSKSNTRGPDHGAASIAAKP